MMVVIVLNVSIILIVLDIITILHKRITIFQYRVVQSQRQSLNLKPEGNMYLNNRKVHLRLSKANKTKC